MFQVHTPGGVAIFSSFHRDRAENQPLQPGRTTAVSVRIPARLLLVGSYEAVFACMKPGGQAFWIAREIWFEVHDVKDTRNEALPSKRRGLVSVLLPWDAQ
jgi:hypothetical protein